MSKKVCFIGHRLIFNKCLELKNAIENEIRLGCTNFIMGTHGNFDKSALQICRDLKCKNKCLNIEVVITSLNLIKKTALSKNEFFVAYEDVRTVYYEIEKVFYKRKITESNYKMIDECDALICYVDTTKTFGGAIRAYKYAKKKGLKIINLFKN